MAVFNSWLGQLESLQAAAQICAGSEVKCGISPDNTNRQQVFKLYHVSSFFNKDVMFFPIFKSCVALKQQYKTQIITEVNVKYQGNTWIKTFFFAIN